MDFALATADNLTFLSIFSDGSGRLPSAVPGAILGLPAAVFPPLRPFVVVFVSFSSF
jgi:hypothetical protein